VTHPDIRRYFMTIREAVQLVLQASTMGKGSEIFVLDMGQPVKIADLAQNMIRLHGKESEIEIRFTGLRPGEKLYEELLTEGENIAPTYHEKIMIFQSERRTERDMERWVSVCNQLINDRNEAALLRHLHTIVPEYAPANQWRRVLKTSGEAAAAVGTA
jgi:FlaA1/EpsC-like NDP-sugar epimerase